MKTNRSVVCPQCGRTVAVRVNRFLDETYVRHKMKTRQMLTDEIFGKVESVGDSAREESYAAANPLAFGIHEIDCPMSGQVVE